MKVIHIIDSGGYYGAEVMLLNLCQEQMRQGLEVEVISLRTPKQAPKALELKLEAAQVKTTPWPMLPLPDPRHALRILRYSRATGANVIHSHGYKGNILLGMIPTNMRGIAVIATMHGYTRQQGISKLALYQWLDRQCLPRLDAVVLVSPSMRDQIPHQQLGDKLHIIANGIAATPQAEQLGYTSLFSANSIKIGALGRLSYEKNFGLLIDAIQLLEQQHPNMELVIYGEGPERTQLDEKIKRYGLTRKVKLPGYLNNPHAFLKDIDLFINCSLTEGMPISLLEAMRAETAIIATAIPANAALLTPNQLCTLNADAMAASINTLICNPIDSTAQQKIDNKRHFLQNYTLETMAQNYSALYCSL